MDERSRRLRCLFSGTVVEEDDSHVVRLPRSEIELGTLTPGESIRIGLYDRESSSQPASETAPPSPQPPVEIGELRYVEIEDIGDQGDGIARVERGYVIIVPGTEAGDRVKVEIVDVQPNFATAEVVEGPA